MNFVMWELNQMRSSSFNFLQFSWHDDLFGRLGRILWRWNYFSKLRWKYLRDGKDLAKPAIMNLNSGRLISLQLKGKLCYWEIFSEICIYYVKSTAKCWMYFCLRIDILELINWSTSAKLNLKINHYCFPKRFSKEKVPEKDLIRNPMSH